MTEKTYSNIDGDAKTLAEMVREEPEWAASRIRECERLEAEVVPELQRTIRMLREHVHSYAGNS